MIIMPTSSARALFYCSVFLLSYSCEIGIPADGPISKKFSGGMQRVELVGETVSHDSLIFYYATDVHLLDSIIVIRDVKNASNHLHILDRKNLEYVMSFAKRGEGPGEFAIARSVTTLGMGKPLMVHDSRLQRLYSINLDSLLNYSNYKISDYVNTRGTSENSLVKSTQQFHVRQISDSLFLARTFPTSDLRFSLFDARFSKIKSFGPHPLIEEIQPMNEEVFQVVVLGNIYQGRMFVNRTKRKMLIAHSKLDLIEIFDYENGANSLNIIGPENNYPPKYQLNSANQAILCDECKYGYLYIDTTDGNIYALYSGKEKGNRDAYLGNTIYKFDWEGNVLVKYDLDREIAGFVIDESLNKIYATESNADQPLVVFDLN